MSFEEQKTLLVSMLEESGRYPGLAEALKNGQTSYPALPFCPKENPYCLFSVEKGIGARIVGGDVPLEFGNYLKNIVMPIVEAHKKKYPFHKFDDRKFRLHGFYRENGRVFLSLGPSCYQQFQADIARTEEDSVSLMLRGVLETGDPYTYHSKILGVTIMPLSAEGYVFIGERSAHIDYPGTWGFVGGSATFFENVSDADFVADAKAELEEEIGYKPEKHEQLCFIGIAGSVFTGELDLVFLLQTGLKADSFQPNNLAEHRKFHFIKNKEELNAFLKTKHGKLLYPTHFGLEHIAKYHYKS